MNLEIENFSLMKKVITTIAWILVVSAVFGQTKSDLQFIEQTLENRGEVVLRFPHNGNRELVRELNRIMSIDKVNDTYAEAYANRTEYEQFKTYGIEYEPVYEYYRQTRALNMATSVAQMANWDRYPTYAVYLEMMQNYAQNYPTLCKMDTIGYSVYGRPIINMTISDNVGVDEDEPEFWWSSTMHGDETSGWYFLIRLVDDLLTKYGTDPQITNLVNNVEIYISPNTNPDGTFYRSNDGTSIANARRYNYNSVDLNRNFPFVTNTASHTAQYPDEPEITMMTAYADAHNFVMSANCHGGDECMNYPWDEDGWTHAAHPNPDDSWWEYISWMFVDTVHAINANRFTGPSDVSGSNGVTKGSEWYSIDGGRQDYMNYYKHIKETTVEFTTTKLLGSENLNTYWGYYRKSILNYTEQVLYGFRGIVTDGCTNQPLSDVKVFINNHDADGTEVYTAAPVGDYHRPIYAGTYSVTFSKDGYVSKTLTVTTQNMASTRLDVSLCPEPTFTTNPAEAYEGRSIQFINTTGCNNSTSWTFEGGSPATSTSATPTVTYNTHGTYNVTLSIVSENGCSTSTTEQIIVHEAIPPTADFSASETLVSIGSPVTFTDLSTNVPTSWQWSFEGGTPATSNEQNPTVTYEEPGVYSVTLVATNDFGSDTETKTAYIEVVSVIDMSNDPIYACSGTYRDPGGDGNYGNNARYTQTIYPSSEGAYVRLTFTQLGLQQTTGWNTTCNDYITIYDGTSTSATQIGQYCGTNPSSVGTNGIVTATNSDGALTIYFYSNNSTVNTGWEAEISCYQPEPVAEFSVAIAESCTRNISITNESEYATSYLWAFGDGTTSTEAEPTHTYTTNGTYTITLTATNAIGNSTATQQIEVEIPEIASVTSANGCVNSNITLSATGTGTLHWFDAATGGTELGTGDSYSANFTETTTLYVEAQQGSEQYYNVGVTNNSAATAYTNSTQNRGLTFTVSQNLTLVSVDVYYSYQTSQNRTITITNSSNTQVYSQEFSLTSGLNTLTLNVYLEPGTYNIYASNIRYTYRQTPSFPYTVDNVISITGQYGSTYGSYYYTFYNWVVKTVSSCSSERTPVTATVIESGNINLGEPITQCGGTVTLNAGNGFDNYSWSNQQTTQSITVAQSGTYRVTATNGQCESTGSVTVTINPVPSVAITSSDNTLTANATSGTGNYQYNWSTNATTQSIAVTSDGNYCVTTTDSNNCTAMACSNFSLPDINIIISNVEHGSINGGNSVEYGSNYTFTVITDACYEIGAVTVNGNVVNLNANNSYTIHNVTAEQTINATFNQISYSITASAGNGGSISPSGSSTVNCGESLSYTITPNNGYLISDLLVDGQSVGSQSSYTFSNVDANHSIYASFEEIPPEEIVVVVNADSNGGSVTPTGTQTITEGDDFTFTVTPNACYEIGIVTVNGNVVNLDATNNSYTITNVTEPQNINVTFNQLTYEITASTGNGGSVNIQSNTIDCGEDLTFSVLPDVCYEIGTVTANGSVVTPNANNSYTITNVTEPQNINVTFNLLTYEITASAGNGGSISPSGSSTVNCGESLSYTITPDYGYLISDLLVDGQSVGSQSTYTFSGVDANHSIYATFEVIPAGEIVIVVNSDSNGGSVSPSGTQTITEGDDFTFTVTPDACYEIGTITVNGTEVTLDENNSYTITNVTTEQTINVTFNLITYTITASAGNGGSITPVGEVEVNCGESKTFTITANEGYEIADVIVDGQSVGAVESYTFPSVSENGHSIVATFNEIVEIPECNAVTDLTARIESYGVVLSWNAVENATSYEVYRNGERIATETGTSSIDLQGHEGDTYYIITNCANGGTSDASETATAIVTGISEVENNIAIFPNPASDILNIISSEEISEIEIVNTLGQVVYRTEVNSDNAVCDVEDLPSGVYVVRISTLQRTETVEASLSKGTPIQKKFVKE